MRSAWRWLAPWLLLGGLVALAAAGLWLYLDHARGTEALSWRQPRAVILLAAAGLVAMVALGFARRRGAVLRHSRVALLAQSGAGWGSWLSSLPAALRVVALGLLAVALARPQTHRIIERRVDSIDIVVVLDMSRSMAETDLPRHRLDAAQRVIRRFVGKRSGDRVGLVVFGQRAMVQSPLTTDMRALDEIVADLVIGDVPDMGTAIGDGLAMALAQLRRSDATSKVVVLLSDGDNNVVTRFSPDDAAAIAAQLGVTVFTVLVGVEPQGWFGEASVNPATLRSMAQVTGGRFFRAQDVDELERSFEEVRRTLDKTRRTIRERVPGDELFAPIALAAAVLVMLELVLVATRLGRLP